MENSLFEFQDKSEVAQTSSFDPRPLAEILRPSNFAQFVGQKKYCDPSSTLMKQLREHQFLPNLIIWGPPGTGKTTFAQLLVHEIKGHLISCNAIDTGAKDLREHGKAARDRRMMHKEKTILFIDEIHRLNRSQQDVLLPFTEKGDLILIGATTENPSYELNSALLSRSKVLLFESLEFDDLKKLLLDACARLHISIHEFLDESAIQKLIENANGDARQLINVLDILRYEYALRKESSNDGRPKNETSDENSDSLPSVNSLPLTVQDLAKLLDKNPLRFDKKGSEHYDVASAFIKSIRGSDPDAGVYYLARMLEGGEDPVFVARRLVILASEDIGNADPRALTLAVSALQAVELIGMPEARIPLAQVVIYLASAPKSNSSYVAINDALEYVKSSGPLPVPLSLRSSQTTVDKSLGFGVGYKYSHDSAKGFIAQQFLPDTAKDKKFFEPTEHGYEKNMATYLAWLRSAR